jgi:hypothetical protein
VIRQLVFGGLRHEGEHEEGIECRPEFFGAFDVIGCVPQEERVPCLLEELLAEFLQSVRKERRYEDAFG